MHNIVFGKEKFRQESPILSGNAGDQRNFFCCHVMKISFNGRLSRRETVVRFSPPRYHKIITPKLRKCAGERVQPLESSVKPPFRQDYVPPCASVTETAVILMRPRTVTEGVRIWAGIAAPIRIGPTGEVSAMIIVIV